MRYKLFVVLIGFMLVLPTTGFADGPRDLIRKYRPDLNQKRVNEIESLVLKYSTKYKIDPKIALAVMVVESKFYNKQSQLCEGSSDRRCKDLKNREKSCGYFQMNPSTFAKTFGVKLEGETELERCRKLIKNYHLAIHAGVKHLADLKKRFGWLEMISVYNAGPRNGGGKTNWRYVLKVLKEYRGIHA